MRYVILNTQKWEYVTTKGSTGLTAKFADAKVFDGEPAIGQRELAIKVVTDPTMRTQLVIGEEPGNGYVWLNSDGLYREAQSEHYTDDLQTAQLFPIVNHEYASLAAKYVSQVKVLDYKYTLSDSLDNLYVMIDSYGNIQRTNDDEVELITIEEIDISIEAAVIVVNTLCTLRLAPPSHDTRSFVLRDCLGYYWAGDDTKSTLNLQGAKVLTGIETCPVEFQFKDYVTTHTVTSCAVLEDKHA